MTSDSNTKNDDQLSKPLTRKQKILMRMLFPLIEMMLWVVMQLSSGTKEEDEKILSDWKRVRKEMEEELERQ